MKSSEFFVTQENWPQPPDDSCTLESTEFVHQPKKKKKKASSSKVKKKMSESLAGVTAAAVAVVMLSSAIPALQDAFIGFPGYSDRSETCLVCGKDDCSYFAEGFSGLRITLDSDSSIDAYDDFQTMQGFCNWNDRYIHSSIPCVETEADQRCVLRIDREIRSHLDYGSSISQNISNFGLSDLSFYGEFFTLKDEKSSASGEYLYIVISYDQTGRDRLSDPDVLLAAEPSLELNSRPYNYITQDIPGVPNGQLQLVSTLGKDLLQELLAYCSVAVIETKDQVFDLGQTMRFSETDAVYRSYGDFEYDAIVHYYDFFNGSSQGITRSLSFDTSSKEYSIGMNRAIIFSNAGWNHIFDLACELNEKAPETGHQVYFPTVELNRYTINNITYRCYLFYTADGSAGGDNSHRTMYYMVPQQETEIAIKFEENVSANTLKTLLNTLDVETAFDPSDVLSQITLR